MRALLILSLFFVGTFTLAQEKKPNDPTAGLTVAVKELEDFVAKSPEYTINNITLKETPDAEAAGKAELKIAYTAKNRSAANKPITVFLVGLDEKGVPVWSHTRVIDLGTMDQETYEEKLSLPVGSLKATASVWLRAVPR
jgi:hypothetical protein